MRETGWVVGLRPTIGSNAARARKHLTDSSECLRAWAAFDPIRAQRGPAPSSVSPLLRVDPISPTVSVTFAKRLGRAAASLRPSALQR
jgi:hypothetical protein